MLKHQLIHPKINEVLARAGHHAKILIADGNYPASTKKGPNAQLVCLNLSPGCVTVAQVLRAVLSAVPVDHVNTMGIPADDPYAKLGEPASGLTKLYLGASGITGADFGKIRLLGLLSSLLDRTLINFTSPRFDAHIIDSSAGNMEGKEVRFGVASSALWAAATT